MRAFEAFHGSPLERQIIHSPIANGLNGSLRPFNIFLPDIMGHSSPENSVFILDTRLPTGGQSQFGTHDIARDHGVPSPPTGAHASPVDRYRHG